MEKKITLEFLYFEMKAEFRSIRQEMNVELFALRQELTKAFDTKLDSEIGALAVSIQNQFAEAKRENNEHFDIIGSSLDHIEHNTLLDHTQQLERLRDNYLVLKTKVDNNY
ncbi:MAG: hypothetical protein EXS50_01655 [Candidatus Taylorbacteria bacterium]|nr:hypothetical protein [Candidatus Taylorbacteria bacterium]